MIHAWDAAHHTNRQKVSAITVVENTKQTMEIEWKDAVNEKPPYNTDVLLYMANDEYLIGYCRYSSTGASLEWRHSVLAKDYCHLSGDNKLVCHPYKWAYIPEFTE